MRTILVLVIACLCHVFTHAQTTLTFDGVDDYTQSNYYSQLDLGTGNFALEAMVSNLDFTISDTLTILAQQNTNSTQGIRWSITNNTILIKIENTSYSMSHTFAGCTHLAVVRDNGVLLFYANHILLGTQSIAAIATISCTSCDLLMGKTIDDNNYFKGALDEVRIWNTARSGVNIESYETTCLDSTAMANTSLVGYWNFEENTGQFANNLGNIACYARLGNTFYSDGSDPTWTTTSCVSSTCYSNGLASFSLSDNNPKEADLVTLNNTSTSSSVVYWNINGDTTVSVDSLQYAFPLGMNVIQLAVTSASGLSARTILLDVKRPKYPCGADEYTTWRQSNNPNYLRTQSLLYRAASAGSSSGKEYHIPVIFHVIANNQATLNAFPTSRIQAQLDTLNKYFAKDSTGISFCLAQEPLSVTTGSFISWGQFGATVPGITYLLDTLEQYDFTNQVYVNELMRKLPFDAEEYLNIYIVDTIIYPGSSFLGVSSVGPNYGTFDGIGLDYDVFVGGAVGPMGKSLIHEVGHWLGLEHVFELDGICDTYEQFNPTSDSSIGNCSTPYSYGTSCPPNPIYNRGQNHMDYHNEPCLTIFTGGQIDRMHYILDNGRPYIHSEYNLIATKVQELGGCVDKTNVSATFIASSESVCAGSTIELKGVEVLLDHWEWQISWDPNKNNGNIAPSTSGVCVSTSPSSGLAPAYPETTVSICEPGIWDVYLTINDTSLVGGNTIVTTDTQSMSIEVLDCSPNDQRNRVTLNFDSTDWQINGATIDNLDAIPSDTTVGHIVTGTGFILNQNSEGVVMRTTVFGSPLWRKAIRIPNADVELFDVVSGVNYMGTDRIALAGRVKRGNTSELLLVIVDRAGNMLFQETYQMEKNGIQQPNAVGLELIQLSNSFNNDLAIVGFVGDGDSVSADKRGFILGINPTTGVQWEHYFESEKFVSTIDYDIAENVTEIGGDFGNGPEAAIVISGHSNRTNGTSSGSGTFISCLTVSGGIVTEQWRTNAEFPSGQGSSKPVAVAYNNGRLFFVSFNSLLHGSLIVEINPNTGVFGIEALINNLYPVDLIIDGTNLILGGRGLSSDGLTAVKIPIPAVNVSNFDPLNITIRSYSSTRTQGAWGGFYNVSSYIKTPQCIVPSANGGYMFIGEYAPTLINNNSFNDIGLVFNKIDADLLTTCMSSEPIFSELSNFPFSYIVSTDSISLTSSLGADTINCDSLITTCYQLGCLLPGYTLSTFEFIKCSTDTVTLVGNFSEIGNFSYQWSPSTYLSNDTILTPTTTTPITQRYNLIITDNTTGCQVAVADYLVTVPPDTINSLKTIYKCPLDTIVLQNSYSVFNTGVFTYQWSPTTDLSDLNILEPTIYATILPVEYTLIATEAGGCTVYKRKITISASGGLVTEHRINCLPSDSSYYVTTGASVPSFNHKMNLNVVLTNLGINDTTGVWTNPIPNSIPLTPPSFDPVTSVLVAGIAANLGTLHYTYGDTTICQNRLILHFEPDASIDGASTIDVCEEAVLTFNASIVDSTIEHHWVIYGYNQGWGRTVIQVIPPGDSLSITGTFSYNPAYQYYKVEHNATSKNCPQFGSSSSVVIIYVHRANGTITVDTCTGTLILPTNTQSDTIQWYDATTGLAITGENTHSYNPPTSGSYYASVTTPQCDFISDTFNYSPLLPINSTATVSSNYNGADISCLGAADGAATVAVSNGLSPYTYLWSNGETLATASNLAAGSSQVTVIDACLDTTITSVILTEPTMLVLTVNTLSNVSCAGLSDGSANLTISGGTAPYTYLWSNTQTTATATGLSAGVHTVTVTDNNGCSVSSTASVTEPNVLSAVLTNTSPISCVGESDGIITATTTGGTTPYTYLWSTGASSSVVNSLGVGTYTVTITDANNCTYINSIILTVPPLPIITTSLTNVSCNGLADGEISTSITGVTAPYTYLWSNTQTGSTATGLVAGGYTVTVTDNNGCSVSSNATITEPAPLTTTLDSTNVNCITANSGVIDNIPTGGTTPYTYLWSNGATSQDVNGLVAGNYCVTITDANNCTIVACTNIEPLITPFSIVKLVDKDTIVPYDTVCYSILVTNNCQASKDVVVTDTLAAGLLVSTLGSFTYDNATSVLSDTLTIAAGATDTLQFKVQVLKTASCGNIDSLINQGNAYELGSPTPIVSDVVTVWIQDTFATNCMPLPDTVYFSDLITTGQLLSSTAAQSTIQTVNVAGVWILDVGLSYSFTSGSILEMSPGAQIIVSSGANLTLNNATVRAACNNCLWQSILVQGDGTISTEKTVLRDAQYAIHAENKAILQYIVKTDFLDNFIGIYVAPNVNNNNLIIGAFENNIFSAPSILPPYVGLQATPTLDISGSQVNVNPNATGGTGLSGILGWDLIALNLNLGTPALSNTFQRLVSGIVLFNTNFSTNSCSFNTIEQNTIYATSLAYQGCGIHLQSPIVLDFKEALIEDCSFEKCFIGISGIGSGMRIYRNQMSEIVDMGVRSIRLFNTVVHVRFNNFSKMERFGVAAFDPRIPSDIWIDNNTMDMTTVPGEGACILISDNSTGDASSLVISNNTLSANEAQNGIAVLNHENSTDPRFSGLIQGNTITMEGNSPDRAGISGSNSRLHIECNTVTGDGLTLGAANTYGIVAGGGPLGGVSTYQCNNVTNTYRGVFFEGFNNEVNFRGNGFDRHDIGLLLDANAAVEPQEYKGNTWTHATNLDAFHQSTLPFVWNLSRFDVNTNSNNNPEFAPHNIGGLGAWFDDNNFGGNFDCIEPFNYCGNSRFSARFNTSNSRNNSTNNPRITGLDNALTRNGLGNISLVTKYNAKRALFRKLVNNPSLANNSLNPHIRSFVARHQNTCIGHFDNITAQCEQAFITSSIDSILLDSCKNICLTYLDSLHHLDSILAINFTNSTATTRNGVANRLSQAIQQQQILLGNIQAQQQIVLTPICANNNSFNTIVLHEVLEKEVNDIYLNTLAKGILEFSSNELVSLRQIAAHCPQEGGAAVHQARGMLSMVEDVNLLNFDCTANNGRSSIIEEGNELEETTNTKIWDLILYPNPTNSIITLESNLVLKEEIQIEIYNALGQKVKEVTINEDINTIDINVSSLLDGIYNIRLESGAYKITKSFVLIK